jgi:hypothetical protein
MKRMREHEEIWGVHQRPAAGSAEAEGGGPADEPPPDREPHSFEPCDGEVLQRYDF